MLVVAGELQQIAIKRRAEVEEFQRKHRAGLLTLLFTDIVDSTRLKQTFGDREAVTVVQRHHAVIREILALFSEGEEIETAGDSFFIVFTKPSDAVKFSLLVQARLRALSAEVGQPVFDRIGIHVGEVWIEEHEGPGKARDLYGLQVDTCARVQSLGQADQILLSQFPFDSARQALRGEELHGIEALSWLNHGPYRLKGVEEPLEICEVGEEGKARLRQPPDSEKAHRFISADREPVLGWRPAIDQTVPGTGWVLEKKLGEGGFGEVWLGRDKRLKTERVFKFCFRADRVRSLKREATLFRLLKERVGEHPNIVTIESVYFDEPPPYYILMQHVAEQDLTSWCASQGGIEKVPLETRLEIVAQIGDALQAAHDSGVIHRDVKPSNILVSDQSERPIHAYLTDFGIGQIISDEIRSQLSVSGFSQAGLESASLSGTQLYMAPELFWGKSASIRSDIYALGVALYQLLAGDFSRPVTTDWAKQIKDPLLREDLAKCFAGDPQDRFAGAAQLAEQLRGLEERREAFDKQQAILEERERAAYRRGILRTAALALIVIGLVSGLAVYAFYQRQEALTQRKAAEEQGRVANAQRLKAEQQTRLALVERAAAELTPQSADRDMLFACQLAKDFRRHATSSDPGSLGEVVGLLDRELEGRGRLCQTYWDYERSGSNNDVGNRIPVRAVAFSPDGRTLVLGDSEARVRILRDGVLSDPILVPSGSVRTLTFCPDGSHVAIGTQSGFISVLDVRDPSPKSNMVELAFPDIGRIQDVWSCSWNDQGDLAAACQNGKIYVWLDLLDSLKSGNLRPSKIIENRVGEVDVPVHALAWVHSSAMLAIGDAAGRLRIWDGQTLSDRVPASANAIWSLASSQDGRLACASWDRSISVWKIEIHLDFLTQRSGPFPEFAPALVRLFWKQEAHDQWVRDVAWVDDDRTIASVGDDGMLKLWNSSDLNPLGAEQSSATELWSLGYSASTKMIATANDDGAVRIYRLALPPVTHGDHANTVICLAFMDTSLVSFDLSGGIEIFERSTLKEERAQVPRDDKFEIRSVRFQPRIKAFVIGYDLWSENRGRLAICYPTGTKTLQTADINEPITLIACHPTEPIVAFLTSRGTLGLRMLPELEPVSDQPDLSIARKSETESVVSMEWSNTGNVLSVALNRDSDKSSELLCFSFDRRKLSPVDSGNPIKIPTLIASLAWHPSDQLVAFGTKEGAIILHSFAGWQTKPIGAHTGAVDALHWSVNGRQLFTGGQEPNVKVWAYDADRAEKLALLTTLHGKEHIRAIITCPDGTAIYTAGTGPKIKYWPESSYSVESILARAQVMVNRNMSESEWLGYNPANEYEKVFENLPALR
jgi:WD40 repeat protein/class 3 adenylate cyclase/tRNA A-37 threonylcarbamoyl transferase component Bud32